MVINMKKLRELSGIKDLRRSWDSVVYLMKYFKGQKHSALYIFLQILLTVLDALVPVVYMIIPGLIINELSADRNTKVIVLLASVLVAVPLLNHLKEMTLRVKASELYRELRRAFQGELQSYVADMEYASLEDPKVAVQLNRISMHAPNAPLEMFSYILRLINSFVKILAVTSIIVYLNPAVIIVLLAIIAINAVVTKKINVANYNFGLELSKLDNEYWNEFYNLTDHSRGKEVRIFRLKDFFVNRYTGIGKKQDDVSKKQDKFGARWRMAHAVTSAVQEAVLYLVAILKVLFDDLALGSMTIFMSAASQFSSAVSGIFNAYLEISSYSMNVDEMKAFRSQPTMLENNGNKMPLYDKHSVIEFRDVSFKYPGSERYALRHLSVKIPCDQKLCIVGENGSGKTTFVKLLTRLYVPTEGEILLDGINIMDYDYVKYQRLFAPVFQDFCRFNMPLSLGIACEENYDTDKLNNAIERAGIKPLVDSLEKGVDTYVGKNIDPTGFEPSGGEDQKIAIARAIYHDAPIYILDEPTAALDPFAEYEIYTKFTEMITDRTAVLITHRMAAVQLAEKILVFQDGNIVESGTHKELYAQGGLYTEMFDKQAEFYINAKEEE